MGVLMATFYFLWQMHPKVPTLMIASRYFNVYKILKNVNIFFSQKFYLKFRYRDYRDDNGNLSGFYWELLALRFTFVIIFEVSYSFFFK
jgi:hypothetical protein